MARHAVVLAGLACVIALAARAASASTPTAAWIYYLAYPGGPRCVVSEVWRVRPDGSDPQPVLPPAVDDFSYETLTSGDTEGVFAVSPTGEYVVRVLKIRS